MSGRIIHGDATPEAWDNAVPARRPRSWANACNACKGYPDEEHTMDENCLVPTEIGTRRPEDDALDRLAEALAEHYRTGDYVSLGMAMQDNWPVVRDALGRLREERDKERRATASFDAFMQDIAAVEQANSRAEAAEAEVRRLAEGLRETEDVLSSVGNWLAGSPEPTAAVIEAIDLRIGKNRALLAASPTDEPIDGETYARREWGEVSGPLEPLEPLDVLQDIVQTLENHGYAATAENGRAALAAVEQLERASLGPMGDGRFFMTSGELRCPQCHDPAPWHHIDGCEFGAALARFQDHPSGDRPQAQAGSPADTKEDA